MLPMINGKTLLECSEEDLQIIIGNPDYRENSYIDYKLTSPLFDKQSENQESRQKKIVEFRNDVCSFANADGGYIVFGVQEDGQGVPEYISGIAIPNNNIDKMELSIKNWLQPIQPRIPSYKSHFINLSNGNYVLILYVLHDYYAPYLHLEEEKNYKIYKRYSNSKGIIPYIELRDMFRQSVVMEKEIESFRSDRISFFKKYADNSIGRNQFLLVHIIPDTFLDKNYDNNVFILFKKKKMFKGMFMSFSCTEDPVPMVEGLRYFHYQKESEARLYNNRIAEIYHPLDRFITKKSNGVEKYYPWKKYLDMIKEFVNSYISEMCTLLKSDRLFVCISMVGCGGVCTKLNEFYEPVGTIDRDLLLCEPCVLSDIRDPDAIHQDINNMALHYMLSLGISYGPEMKELLKDVQV